MDYYFCAYDYLLIWQTVFYKILMKKS